MRAGLAVISQRDSRQPAELVERDRGRLFSRDGREAWQEVDEPAGETEVRVRAADPLGEGRLAG
ncbi:MAG: hypothetical protein IPF66_05135 [Holophagales bacterium]|nr:hypothetical protein [Holophagales bacterium]